MTRGLGLVILLWTLAPSAARAGEPVPTPTASITATATRAATATPHVVEIHVGDGVAGPGDAVHLRVSLGSTNAMVAAVAHEITFPSDVVTLDPKDCSLNPAVPKELRADVVDESEDATTVRIVVQSSRNLDSIADGPLYTCSFLVSPLALPGTYTIASGFAAAYAASGAEFRNVRGTSGEITVSLIGEPCIGDCNASGNVTVDEILTGVSMALGVVDVGSCPEFDGDVSGTITVDELVTTVTNGLDGCNLPPSPQPTPTPTSPPARTPIFVRLSGNDANSGLTPGRALRTISRAALAAPSGYRIIVGPGTYVEGVTTDGQGRAPENLVFEADVTGTLTGDPPGAVVVDATDSQIAAAFRLTKATATVIDGFTIRGGADGGIVIKNASDDFVIRNCIIADNPGAGIRIQDSARTLIFNNLVYANGREGIAIVGQGAGSDDASVINNTVYGNFDRGLRVGTSSVGSPGALVRNNIFQLNGIGFAPALENIKAFPTSEPDYDGNFNLVFPATYLPIDLAGDQDVNADAEFIDAGTADFRLSFGSPAIDAGGALPAELESHLAQRSVTGTGPDDGRIDLGYHFAP